MKNGIERFNYKDRVMFSNKKSDIEWLKDTHLKGKDLKFGSFMIYGNEDCPAIIEIYKAFDPHYKTKPFKVFEYDGEDYKEVK